MEKIMKAFFDEKAVERHWFLLKHELGVCRENAERIAVILAAVSALAFSVIAFFLMESAFWIAVVFVIFFIAGYFLLLVFMGFVAEKRQELKNKECAGVLMQASLMPKGTPAELLAEHIAKGNYLIAGEFERACREIRLGKEPSKALNGISERCEKENVKKTVQLLKMAELTGSISPEMLREEAEEILEAEGLKKEQSALLTIQRLTVIIAGVFLVPFILGLVSGTMQGLDFGHLTALDLGAGESSEAREAASSAGFFYSAELAVISALYLAMLDRNSKKAVLYLFIMLPVGLAVFVFASGNGFW